MLNEGLYKNYPKTKGKVDYYDLATPLTCEHYCNVYNGSIYGIMNSCTRYNQEYDELLTPETDIKGLWMTG
jgi:all-trans-retinol 13,14-reductase